MFWRFVCVGVVCLSEALVGCWFPRRSLRQDGHAGTCTVSVSCLLPLSVVVPFCIICFVACLCSPWVFVFLPLLAERHVCRFAGAKFGRADSQHGRSADANRSSNINSNNASSLWLGASRCVFLSCLFCVLCCLGCACACSCDCCCCSARWRVLFLIWFVDRKPRAHRQQQRRAQQPRAHRPASLPLTEVRCCRLLCMLCALDLLLLTISCC